MRPSISRLVAPSARHRRTQRLAARDDQRARARQGQRGAMERRTDAPRRRVARDIGRQGDAQQRETRGERRGGGVERRGFGQMVPIRRAGLELGEGRPLVGAEQAEHGAGQIGAGGRLDTGERAGEAARAAPEHDQGPQVP